MTNTVKRFLKKTVALAGVVLCASSGYALQQDVDGFYKIGSVSDWREFATLIQTMPTVNVKMVSDIDLGDDQTRIGTVSESDHTYKYNCCTILRRDCV